VIASRPRGPSFCIPSTRSVVLICSILNLAVEVAFDGDWIERKSLPSTLQRTGLVTVYFHTRALWEYRLRFLRKEKDSCDGWLASANQLLLLKPCLRLGGRNNVDQELQNRNRVRNCLGRNVDRLVFKRCYSLSSRSRANASWLVMGRFCAPRRRYTMLLEAFVISRVLFGYL
jgi:hypothetical protein